ncbi:hypothetical protein DRN34_01055, partial [Thermococci archaeon]
ILTGVCGEVSLNKKARVIGEMQFDIKHIIRTQKAPSGLKFLARFFTTKHQHFQHKKNLFSAQKKLFFTIKKAIFHDGDSYILQN